MFWQCIFNHCQFLEDVVMQHRHNILSKLIEWVSISEFDSIWHTVVKFKLEQFLHNFSVAYPTARILGKLQIMANYYSNDLPNTCI